MGNINKIQTTFSAGEISPFLKGRVDVDKYASSCQTVMNYLVMPFGSLTHRPGLKFIKKTKHDNYKCRLVPFQYSNTDSYIIEFQKLGIRFYRNQGIILDSRTLGNPIYEISSPYSDDEVEDLRFAQSFDTLYICHKDFAPRKLVRQDHDLWTLSEVAFDEPPFMDLNATSVTLTPSAVTGSGVTITASSATFASTDVGRAIRLRSGVDSADTVQYTGTGTQTYFDITFYPQGQNDVDVYLVNANGSKTKLTYNATPGAGQFKIIDGQVMTGFTPATSEKIQISRANAGSGVWGWATITGYTSTTVVTVTVESDFGGTNATTYWRLGAWSETTGYPRVCTFHEQRLWFANTTAEPRNIWGSATGDFENFSPDNADMKGQIDDDTSVTLALNTPAVHWIKGLKALLVGCADGVIQITGASGSITPSSVRTKKDTSLPTEFADIAATSDDVLFIELLGKNVHSVKYSFQSDGFETAELTTLASHMAGNSKFTQLAYTSTPYKVLWAITEAGDIVSCTYVPEQNLVGWCKHTIGGTDVVVESIAAIAGETYSELWACVKRTINGSTVRYVECLQKYFNGDAIEDSFFLDSGSTYDGSPTTSISGLSHLEGEEVSIIVDGATHPNKTVSAGAITLDYAGSKVHVGLYEPAYFETQFIEGGSANGTNQITISAIQSVGVRFHETVGGEIGYDSSSTTIIPFRDPTVPMNSAVPAFSGDKIITFTHGYDKGYKVYVSQPYALPSTVLMMVYKAKVADR